MATPEQTLLSIRDGHFVDQHGRVALLRGVNLGGSSKLPYGYAHSDEQDFSSFYDGAKGVSFVNRPFPLEEADVHFSRLRRWGLSFLRFIVTWEAIEHDGPGVYDRDYLAYVRAVVAKAAEYGMIVYIDPHQDVWSRWTGGDGAPMWTLESVGLEPRHFAQTGAALCVETCGLPASQFPKMIWPTNSGKLAAATMFTLFFAGKKLAPKCHVDGVQIQEYLQSHYLGALEALAKELKGLSNVAGFGTLNEPMTGYIGVGDLAKTPDFKNGLTPTFFQTMLLGEGVAQDVEVWNSGLLAMLRNKPAGRERIDPKGVRAWKPSFGCVWKAHGVWDVDAATGQPKLLRPDYFKDTDFGRECYLPFAKAYAQRIQRVLPDAMIFAEMPPMDFGASEFPEISPRDVPNAVNAAHWYDIITLLTTSWRSYVSVDFFTGKLVLGNAALRKLHTEQLAHAASFARDKMHNAPTLIGETGIPFNLDGAGAFTSGDFSAQVGALDHTIACLEANLLSYTLWNYTADNSHKYGDLWNREDLSLSSPDSEALVRSLSKGVAHRDDSARALRAFARPYAAKIAGVPSKSAFDLAKGEYVLEYSSASHAASKGTEVFVPYAQYPQGYKVAVVNGKVTIDKHDGFDIVHCEHGDSKATFHRVVISSSAPPAKRENRPMLHLAVATSAVGLALMLYNKRK
jgi:hypothetical protein